MAEPIPVMKTVFHKDTGPVQMYAIDAHNAVTQHSKEYSYEPWDGTEGPNTAAGEPRAIVPNGWVDLKPSEKIALARDLGGKDIRSGAAAEDFINDYLVERANASSSDSRPATSERPNAEAREVQRSATLEVQEGRTDPAKAPAPLGPKENNPKD